MVPWAAEKQITIKTNIISSIYQILQGEGHEISIIISDFFNKKLIPLQISGVNNANERILLREKRILLRISQLPRKSDLIARRSFVFFQYLNCMQTTFMYG